MRQAPIDKQADGSASRNAMRCGVQALVTTLADAGVPFEEYESELSAEALEGLKALKIDEGSEKDPLMQLEVLSVGDRDVGEIERYKSG